MISTIRAIARADSVAISTSRDPKEASRQHSTNPQSRRFPAKENRISSAELLGQTDDDALRTTQEAEPVDALVLRDLSDEFGTAAAQAGDDVVDVVDSEHDPAYAQRVRRRVFPLGSDRRRRVKLRQLNPAV